MRIVNKKRIYQWRGTFFVFHVVCIEGACVWQQRTHLRRKEPKKLTSNYLKTDFDLFSQKRVTELSKTSSNRKDGGRIQLALYWWALGPSHYENTSVGHWCPSVHFRDRLRSEKNIDLITSKKSFFHVTHI